MKVSQETKEMIAIWSLIGVFIIVPVIGAIMELLEKIGK